MIFLDRISFENNGTPVLNDFSMRIRIGERACLVGPSGIGKSSLLHIVAGLLPPSQGTCQVNTEKIAYAFQNPPLLPWFTVDENIRFFANRGALEKNHGKSTYFLEKTGLTHSANKKPGELSGGMKKRAGIACALACEAELLLLDEPFASLDRDWQMRLADVITEHVEDRQITLLMVSHETGPLNKMGIDSTPLGINIK